MQNISVAASVFKLITIYRCRCHSILICFKTFGITNRQLCHVWLFALVVDSSSVSFRYFFFLCFFLFASAWHFYARLFLPFVLLLFATFFIRTQETRTLLVCWLFGKCFWITLSYWSRCSVAVIYSNYAVYEYVTLCRALKTSSSRREWRPWHWQ